MKINNKTKKRKGFTLIEFMAVIAIVGVFVAVTLAYLGQGRTDRELEAAANNVYAAIREAQNYSLTGESVVAGSGCNRFRFSFHDNANQDEFRIANINSSNDECKRVSDYDLGNNVSFTSSGTIDFSIPSGRIDVVGGVYAIVLEKGGKTHVVCVYPMGAITHHAGSTCSPNP